MKDNFAAKFAAKWPEEVANRGFVPVPKCLITCMVELKLKPQEAVALFNIIERCWKAGDKAWPSVNTIGKNIGKGNSTTRGILTSLEEKGFISKEQRFNDTNLYDLEPAAEKLAAHMKDCRHTARKQEGYRQKSSGRDSQDTSDYIEPNLNRNIEVEPLYSHSSINVADNRSDNHSKCTHNPTGSRHEWREFEVEKHKGEEAFTRYYFTCAYCGKQFHKDRERPWQAEYPLMESV